MLDLSAMFCPQPPCSRRHTLTVTVLTLLVLVMCCCAEPRQSAPVPSKQPMKQRLLGSRWECGSPG